MRRVGPPAVLTLALLSAPSQAGRVRVALHDYDVCGVVVLFGLQAGYFSRENVRVEVVRLGGKRAKFQALLSGQVEAICSALLLVEPKVLQKSDFRIVADGSRAVAGKPAKHRWLVRKDLAGSVRTYADLRGKTIWTLSSDTLRYAAFVRRLQGAGLSTADVHLLYSPDKRVALSMLLNKRIDIGDFTIPFAIEAVRSGLAEVFAGSDVNEETEHTTLLIYSRVLWKDRPETALAVMKGYLRAARHLMAMPAAQRRAFLERLWGVPVSDLENETFFLDPEGRVDDGWLAKMQAYAQQQGWIQPGFDLKKLVDPSFARRTTELLFAEPDTKGQGAGRRR